MDAFNEEREGRRGRAFRLVGLAYLLAAGAAFGAGFAVRGWHPIWVALVADVAATGVVFGFSVSFDNSSFYDPYWSVAPAAIVAFWALWPVPLTGNPVRLGLVAVLVCLWGARLTWNWARGWSGLSHEDWRYRDIRTKTGRAYWPASLAGIHLFPTAVVFGGLVGLYPALTSARAFSLLDVAAAAVTLGAIIIEATADKQLLRFRRSNPPREQVMEQGLWRYARHPNYFGEISFWWGLFLFCLAAAPAWWPAVAGPVAMTAMFTFISLPMIDHRMLARRPAYAERMRRVSAIVPWLSRSPASRSQSDRPR